MARLQQWLRALLDGVRRWFGRGRRPPQPPQPRPGGPPDQPPRPTPPPGAPPERPPGGL
jgi:hypothetical protein